MPSDLQGIMDTARDKSLIDVMAAHGFKHGKSEGRSIHFDKKGSPVRIHINKNYGMMPKLKYSH